MQESWPTINERRFLADFEALSTIGKVGKTGVDRPALSPAHLESRAWLRKKIEQASLAFRQDGAGNHSAYLACGPQGAPSLVVGSHLDSVPTGGRYDGALGVLAGLEVLRSVQEADLRLPFQLELFDFTDEEGTLVSFLGSFAFAGLLKAEDLLHPRGSQQALQTGLQRASLSMESILSARRNRESLAGYLELHVEQGPRLDQNKTSIGVVTHIAGIAFYRLVFKGRPDHAGTISMADRLDAGAGASSFSLALRELLLGEFSECFANIGQMQYEPGGFNIVPERAVVSLEFRATTQERFNELRVAVLALAHSKALEFGLGLEVEFLGKRDPVQMDPGIRMAIEKAADGLGLSRQPIISRAGHDAQAVASLCPAGMIFIPSENGVSHSPDEFSNWQDCVQGANVLLHTVLQYAAARPKD